MGFFESGGKAAKFQTPGDRITGTITRPYREAQVTKYGTAEPDFWPDGSPKMQAIVDLQTSEREDSDDDGVRTLYIASTRQRRALSDAIRKAGAKDLEPGGVLTLQYVGNDPKSKNPQNPAKMYAAEYAPPAAPVGSLAPSAQPQVTPAPQGYQATVQAAPAQPVAPVQAGLTPDVAQKARDLVNMGIAPEQAAAALGTTVDLVRAALA